MYLHFFNNLTITPPGQRDALPYAIINKSFFGSIDLCECKGR